MDLTIPEALRSELAAAFFQVAITLGLALVCGWLYRRYRKPYFGWWALATVLIAWVTVAAVCVLLTPIDHAAVETHRLTGSVMDWSWVRLFSPLVNTYAALFLIGGAVVSAMRFRKRRDTYNRFVGNVLIAVGALLPGIGGAATRMGFTEVLYVMEFVGLTLIWLGYRWNVKEPATHTLRGAQPALGIGA
ncbi:MAG: hypothetical protein OER90_11445 [Gemmatimonadota bacterium]|nr:hypothetical protein [Gemmatimonadota bacterium]